MFMKMVDFLNIDKLIWRCRLNGCDTKLSIRSGSFFSGSKMPLSKIILFFHLWVKNYPSRIIMEDFEFAPHTVVDWNRFLREFCVSFYDRNTMNKIGGPNKVVELDETLIVKRKYNRGRVLKEQWLFGGICRKQDNRQNFEIFVEFVDDRTASTLLEIIERRIEPGSIVITDGWRAYNNIEQLGMTHHVIIHEDYFVDPEFPEIHTQNIENLWLCLKRMLRYKGTNREPHCWEYIAEFLFRKQNKDLFQALILEIQLNYPLQ